MLKFLRNLWDTNQRELKRIAPLVTRINELEAEFSGLSDQDLRAKTGEFKTRLQQGESLDDLLPEAFATVREAAKRTLGQRHFDVQLIGGVVLHEGKIAEMKTGEGKTLAATLPAYLNALTGRGVHVVTVNDYLAKRDSEWMGQIYRFLGLSVGVILHVRPRRSGGRPITPISPTERITSSVLTTSGITWPIPQGTSPAELHYAIVDSGQHSHRRARTR